MKTYFWKRWPDFGVQSRDFVNMRARFVPDENPDPYCVLGVDPTADAETVRQAWRALVGNITPIG